jgi:magnesium chelatase family protein
VTEVLRQPLEDGHITITRAVGHFTFPCSFMLVCAMNPCKCGYYGHPTRACTCRAEEIKKYMSKISGPLLDRIDIQIEMPALSYEEISTTAPAEPSSAIRARVNAARRFARERFGADSPILCNAQMDSSAIRHHCVLSEQASAMMQAAYTSMNLSARGYDRILRLARTIADLAASPSIESVHLAEAIQLRSLDRKYW